MDTENIKAAFYSKDFSIVKIEEIFNGEIIVIVKKDYSKKFTLNFNGNITLKVVIKKDLFKNFNSLYYPKFYEESGLIEKKANNHINPDGTICYAPYSKPINEKWKIIDFVVAVDSLINDYFNKEYIGRSALHGLRHGKAGLIQYNQENK